MSKRLLAGFVAVLMTMCMAVPALSACSNETEGQGAGASGEETLRIVSTLFAPYDWTRQVLGGSASHVELTLLLDDGVDLHSFQPTVDDMITLSSCDLLIYTGGESDEWVAEALENLTNPDMIVINLLEVLGSAVKEEELVEGMQDSSAHTHEDDDDHAHEDETDHAHSDDSAVEADHDHSADEPELDEHVWLSLGHAATLTTFIAEQLALLDPEHASTYTTNAEAYTRELAALDEEYAAATAASPVKTLLFADRFPFRYLVDDYGLSYYAAFAGCSAETEASFETVVFLAEKINELDLAYVMVIETSDEALARTVIQSTTSADQEILTMNSLQSVTADDIAAGDTYLSLMQYNLDILKTALEVH